MEWKYRAPVLEKNWDVNSTVLVYLSPKKFVDIELISGVDDKIQVYNWRNERVTFFIEQGSEGESTFRLARTKEAKTTAAIVKKFFINFIE